MPTAESYTIGELARAAGVPTSTVRYYEKRGLLPPDARTGGNYPAYGESSLQRLSFNRTAQAAGLSLHDVAALLSTVVSGDTPCPEVRGMLTTIYDFRNTDPEAVTASASFAHEHVALDGSASE